MAKFIYIESKNCKNQIKGIYEVEFAITESFIQSLKSFGELKILDFSKFSPKAKTFFKIIHQDIYSIEGALSENILFFSCKKEHLYFKTTWEDFLKKQ